MNIDMTNFKMVYKDQIYNCLSMFRYIEDCGNNELKLLWLEVTFINLDNSLDCEERTRQKACHGFGMTYYELEVM